MNELTDLIIKNVDPNITNSQIKKCLSNISKQFNILEDNLVSLLLELITDKYPKISCYIVWKPYADVLGVHKFIENAIKTYKSHCNNCTDINIDMINNGILYEADYIAEGLFCGKINVYKSAKVLYFLFINEEYGGESYAHGPSWFITDESKEKLIDIALSFYDDAYDRDDDTISFTRKEMEIELRTKEYIEMPSEYCESINFKIWSKEITM